MPANDIFSNSNLSIKLTPTWTVKMNWKLQLIGQRILDFVPFSEKLHKIFEKTGTNAYGHKIREILAKRKMNHWKFFCDNTSFEFKEKNVIEIGTGWEGLDLIFLHLLGVREIHTIDRIRHLNLKDCLASIEGLEMVAPDIEFIFGVQDVAGKLKQLPKNSLDALLKQMNVHYYVGTELNNLDLDESSIDLFYSYSCLHLLPLSQLNRTLQAANKMLKNDAYLYTDVRFVDIFINHDPNLNPFAYLQYSDWFWNLLQSRKFNNQSRIRHIEYLERLKEIGFELIMETTRDYENSEEFLKQVKLNKRFMHMDKEDIKLCNASMIHRPKQTL
jgi:hypothetical protein